MYRLQVCCTASMLSREKTDVVLRHGAPTDDDFQKIFVQYGDVPIMARYALGADARTASSAQLRQFTKAFEGYISRKLM